MEQVRAFINEFIQIDNKEWTLFQTIMKEDTCKKGSVLLKIGDECKFMYFIISGSIRMFCYKKENEETYDFGFENDFAVDYRSFLTAQPATLGIEALEDLIFVSIKKEALLKLNKTSVKMREFSKIMTEIVYIYLDERLQSILYDEPIERYKKLLEKQPELLQRVPLQYIASYLGVRPETLSRFRKKISISKKVS
jgi:CRP/FNR family transcriptional regulator, anaerobic regulatory protein